MAAVRSQRPERVVADRLHRLDDRNRGREDPQLPRRPLPGGRAPGVKALPDAPARPPGPCSAGEATEAWGVPPGQLSDNGLWLLLRLRGIEVLFERPSSAPSAWCLPPPGPTTPRPAGRSNASSRPSRSGYAARPLARDLADLQVQVDEFVDLLQPPADPTERLGRATPAAGVGSQHPASDQSRDSAPRTGPGHRGQVVNGIGRGRGRPLHHPHRHRMDHPPSPGSPHRRHPRRRVHRPPTRPRPRPRHQPPLPGPFRPPPRRPPPSTPPLTSTVRDVPRHTCQTCTATQHGGWRR